MKIISIYNNIESIGKSTISMLLANGIARHREDKVCVVDLAKDIEGKAKKHSLKNIRKINENQRQPNVKYADIVTIDSAEDFEKIKQEYDVIFLDLNEGLSREEIVEYLLQSHHIYVVSVAQTIEEFKIDKSLVKGYFAKAIPVKEVPLEKIGFIINFLGNEAEKILDEKIIIEKTNEVVYISGLHETVPLKTMTTFNDYMIPSINNFIAKIETQIFDEPSVLPMKTEGELK